MKSQTAMSIPTIYYCICKHLETYHPHHQDNQPPDTTCSPHGIYNILRGWHHRILCRKVYQGQDRGPRLHSFISGTLPCAAKTNRKSICTMATETVTRPARLSLPQWTQVPETKVDCQYFPSLARSGSLIPYAGLD